ncbi:MAG: hypothetical protein ACI87O_001532 [Planctomycetota bacterium]|jgi:hypothetical protein
MENLSSKAGRLDGSAQNPTSPNKPALSFDSTATEVSTDY